MTDRPRRVGVFPVSQLSGTLRNHLGIAACSREEYPGTMNAEVEHPPAKDAPEIGSVFWGPAWVVGVLGRLVAMPDSSTVAESWGPEGWLADDRVTIEQLLRSGIPATETQLRSLGLLPELDDVLATVASEA